MVNISEKIIEGYRDIKVRIAHMLIIGYGTYAFTQPYTNNIPYHISGALASITARIIDHMATIPAIKLMNTPEFRNSEQYEKFYEKNILTGKHPTMKEYVLRAILQDLLIIGISAHFPPAGYAYLSMMPFVSIHNKKRIKKLEEIIESQKKPYSSSHSSSV